MSPCLSPDSFRLRAVADGTNYDRAGRRAAICRSSYARLQRGHADGQCCFVDICDIRAACMDRSLVEGDGSPRPPQRCRNACGVLSAHLGLLDKTAHWGPPNCTVWARPASSSRRMRQTEHAANRPRCLIVRINAGRTARGRGAGSAMAHTGFVFVASEPVACVSRIFDPEKREVWAPDLRVCAEQPDTRRGFYGPFGSEDA